MMGRVPEIRSHDVLWCGHKQEVTKDHPIILITHFGSDFHEDVIVFSVIVEICC